MSVVLLSGVGANATGTPAPVSGLTGRVTARGDFTGAAVVIEVSPASSGDDWFVLTSMGLGDTLEISQPWARIRALTPGGLLGTADVYFNPYPLAF